MRPILFLKATIRGGAAADLFATPTQVAGYTNANGTFVATHTAIRHKRHDGPKATQQASLNFDALAPKPAHAALDQAPPAPKAASDRAAGTDWIAWWDKELTGAGRRQAMAAAGVVRGDGSPYPDKILWNHLPGQKQAKLQELWRSGSFRASLPCPFQWDRISPPLLHFTDLDRRHAEPCGCVHKALTALPAAIHAQPAAPHPLSHFGGHLPGAVAPPATQRRIEVPGLCRVHERRQRPDASAGRARRPITIHVPPPPCLRRSAPRWYLGPAGGMRSSLSCASAE